MCKNYRLSKRSLSRLEGVEPKLIELLKEAIIRSPYDFGIPREGGLRTAEDQHILFLKGASKCDGYKHKSKHQSGVAFDIYGYVEGKATWDKEILTSIAEHILKVAANMRISLTWGGDWKNFKDMPHFEIRK